MIFVQDHDVVAVFDELKIGEFLLVDAKDVFLLLLFFLLLELFCVKLVVEFEKVKRLVCSWVSGWWFLDHGLKFANYIN